MFAGFWVPQDQDPAPADLKGADLELAEECDNPPWWWPSWKEHENAEVLSLRLRLGANPGGPTWQVPCRH